MILIIIKKLRHVNRKEWNRQLKKVRDQPVLNRIFQLFGQEVHRIEISYHKKEIITHYFIMEPSCKFISK